MANFGALLASLTNSLTQNQRNDPSTVAPPAHFTRDQFPGAQIPNFTPPQDNFVNPYSRRAEELREGFGGGLQNILNGIAEAIQVGISRDPGTALAALQARREQILRDEAEAARVAQENRLQRNFEAARLEFQQRALAEREREGAFQTARGQERELLTTIDLEQFRQFKLDKRADLDREQAAELAELTRKTQIQIAEINKSGSIAAARAAAAEVTGRQRSHLAVQMAVQLGAALPEGVEVPFGERLSAANAALSGRQLTDRQEEIMGMLSTANVNDPKVARQMINDSMDLYQNQTQLIQAQGALDRDAPQGRELSLDESAGRSLLYESLVNVSQGSGLSRPLYDPRRPGDITAASAFGARNASEMNKLQRSIESAYSDARRLVRAGQVNPIAILAEAMLETSKTGMPANQVTHPKVATSIAIDIGVSPDADTVDAAIKLFMEQVVQTAPATSPGTASPHAWPFPATVPIPPPDHSTPFPPPPNN